MFRWTVKCDILQNFGRIRFSLCPQDHLRCICQFFGTPTLPKVLGFSSFRPFARFIEVDADGRASMQLVDAADSNTDSAAGMTVLSNQSLYRSRNFFSTRETFSHFMSIFVKLVRTAVLFCSFNSKSRPNFSFISFSTDVNISLILSRKWPLS